MNLLKGLLALIVILAVHAACKEWRTGREGAE
jgi:hypothetical protein